MYGTKAAFDYIMVGGRCAYETNKVFEFPEQSFTTINTLYTTNHDGIRCDFVDTSSYLEVSFDSIIDSSKYYMLRLVYYAKNVDNLKLKITWKKEYDNTFCDNCYENIILELSPNTFLYKDIDLRQNSEWVGKITNLRLGVFNSEIVPLFIKYFSVYSLTTYKCSNTLCKYYSKYKHTCSGGKDLHILSGRVLNKNTVNIVSDSKFKFSIYDVIFSVEFESGNYFLDVILDKLNDFFSHMPVPNLKIIREDGRLKLKSEYIKSIIVYTELSEKLGFFDSNALDSYDYTIESAGNSDYVDVAGNLSGIYRISDVKNLDFNKVFYVGFSDKKDLYPESSFDFLDQTVIFYTLAISFNGYLNNFEIYCKVFSGGGKILIYRKNGDTYEVVNSYSLAETNFMFKHTINWPCRVYKGDVIGIYNLKIGVSKDTTGPINYYGVISGYSGSISKINIENVSFSSVSFYAYFKAPTKNDIPIVAIYNEVSYIDKLSFSLNYSNFYDKNFNIIVNNNFNYKITGCEVNVKDNLGVITHILGEIEGIQYLSDNKVYSDISVNAFADSQKPPIDLLSMVSGDSLRYSWHESIIDIYKNDGYVCTFIPGSVLFYYEFPTTIDICSVLIHSAKKNTIDNYLLEILDITKVSPSFSNSKDIVTLDNEICNWKFNVENCINTKGIGIFVYNYEELPNISFSEIEIFTKIGDIPNYVIDVSGIVENDVTVLFDLENIGAKTYSYIGTHLKSLFINIGFITDNRILSFDNINIYSSYIPDDYFVSSDSYGEGTLKIYNTRLKKLDCYLCDYNTNLLDNLVYEYDFNNNSLYRGFVPTRYTHSKFYFVSSDYSNNEYNTYALKNLVNTVEFFVTKYYNFKSNEYTDWYVPYDYLVPGYDGEFIYINGALKLRPLESEAVRWFNYINIHEFYNNIDIELSLRYIGNFEDFVFIGLTCCSRDYTNYLKFYCAFQTSSEYGIEFKLKEDADPTYYKFSAFLGRDAALKINKNNNIWTFYCFYSGEWHKLTSLTLFDTEILISISTLFNAPAIKGNIIAEFKTCTIKASKIIYGKKIFYTINDELSYIYGGHVLNDSTIIDNLNKDLTFIRECTIKKFVYDFNVLSVKYLKFVNTNFKNIKITEIKCYLNDILVSFEHGMVSYSDDLFFGTLEGNSDYFDDNVIINKNLSESISKGSDDILSTVGVKFNKNVGVNKAIVYYINETGTYEPLRIMYSYDNITYYDVYDNFSLFSSTTYTSLHCLFNEFSGYKSRNEILYDFVSNNQYSTYFSSEGILSYKWSINSSYDVDSGGVWLRYSTGVKSLYSKFSIDGDFIIDLYFDSFSNYTGGNADLCLKIVFKNSTYYGNAYIYQRFNANRIYTRYNNISIESNRTFGGLRIKRLGSIFYYYYRKYGTTWYEISSRNYGSDYIYPVDIDVYISGNFDVRIEKIIITTGIGVADTDFLLIESPSVNSLFVRGRQFNNNNTYAIARNYKVSELSYPFSFSLLYNVNSVITNRAFLVSKPYSFELTYVNKDLLLYWFSEYSISLNINNVLLYSSTVNAIDTVSVRNYNVDKNLFTDISDSTIKAIYKSRYDINTIIDETFKTGEGTFDKEYESFTPQQDYFFDNFIGNDGDLYNTSLWTGSISGIEIKNNKLHMFYSNNYTYVDAKYVPVGDFDVQVDFSIGQDHYNSYWSQRLCVYFKNGDNFYIGYERYGYNSNYLRYITSAYINSIQQSTYYYNSTIKSGTFKITKIGLLLSSYFLINSKYFRFADYYLFEDSEVDYIRLFRNSWNTSPPVECYFDNFIINNDFDFCNDIVVDGNYSYIDKNYIKLIGGNVRTNKPIVSSNTITFEWSITVENYNSEWSYGFVVCNIPFRNSYNDHNGESIYIVYYSNVFRLYVNGYAYNYIYSGDNKLFYPIYGKPYIIGIKFMPGTGTIIYWQGPTNGYLVINYIISGNLYAWCGNMYGKGTYGSQISTIHRFRCFEDKYLYKELKNNWLVSVGVNDYFNVSDGRSPNFDRWIVNGNPKIYNKSLKLVSTNGDKLQSKVFFCAPFEIVLDYSNLLFNFVEGSALSLNVEAYDSCKDTIFGMSKFKVGYSGGIASWVNYYCSGLSGNSSVYHISDLSNRKLKIVNDGNRVQYFLSDDNNWIIILSQICNKQYYYKLSIEGTAPNIVVYLNSIIIDSEEFMTPTDAVALIPTSWKFSPTNKAYQDIVYIGLNKLISGYKHFSIDLVAKIDDSMFLSYIEVAKDLVNFNGAKVVGDNYITLISAIDKALNGEVIYVLPGIYNIGGYTIIKDIIIIGIGNYNDIIISINGSSTYLDGCEIIFKNITIHNKIPNVYKDAGFKTVGNGITYFTMDNCKYSSVNYVTMIRGEGIKEYYVYLRHCYFYFQAPRMLATVYNPYKQIILDIFDCRMTYTTIAHLLLGSSQYQIRSKICDNTSKYEPKVINTVPTVVLFSPHNITDIYLNTSNGLEKIIKCKKNEFNYLSVGNTLGGVTFYGGSNDYYFSEYFMPYVDDSFRVFMQGYIDIIRVFDRYQTYIETLNNIDIVNNLGLNVTLAHNDNIVKYKIYEPLNLYNSSLYLGKGTSSIIDEFIWSKTETTSNSILKYYNSYLKKLGYSLSNIYIDKAKYKFFIDFGSTIGVGSLVQSVLHNFTNVEYYSDNIDNPSLLNQSCSLSKARWYVLYDDISYSTSVFTPGKFSIFPVVTGCDEDRWKYTGENGYVDLLLNSVLTISSSLTNVYNVLWKRNKTNINDYLVSVFSDSIVINIKLFGGGICDKIIIKSGYNIGTEITGYITECNILVDNVNKFSVANNINSIIIAKFDSISFNTIDIIIKKVKQTSNFVFNATMLTGNVVFINYIKVLSKSLSSTFSNTLCNAYEFNLPLKFNSINTKKIGTCSPNYYYSFQYINECVNVTNLDFNNLPSTKVTSMLVKTDNLYDCGFILNDYFIDVPSKIMTSSIESWKVYIGDVYLYKEMFYIQGNLPSVGLHFSKETVFEVGTYKEDFGVFNEWAVTDELVLGIYSTEKIDSFYLCIGDKINGRYYRWDFNLVVGWNNFRFNFYDSHVTRFVYNLVTKNLLFNDLEIYNVWCGGIYNYGDGFIVLDNIFIDRASVSHVLSSHKDSFYIPINFESESGSIYMDYKSYWDNTGVIFGNIWSDKVLLTVFANELSFSLVNKINGQFVLGVYSYKFDLRTTDSFGYAQKFDINDIIKLRLEWSCYNNKFFSYLYINNISVGKIILDLIEVNKIKVTGIMIGGGSVYISSIYNSLSLCGEVKYIKIYSSNNVSKLTNDNLFVDGKNLVENSPMYIGKIEPGNFVSLPVKYTGKSRKLNQLNLHIKWIGIY